MKTYKYIALWIISAVTAIFFLYGIETETYRKSDITEKELSKHVYFLASDELEGRRAGSYGALKAAEYIATEFITYGLFPHPDIAHVTAVQEYLQPFDFPSGIQIGENNYVSVTINGDQIVLEKDKDFRTLPFSASSTTSGNLVFAGFGITAQSDSYNDYEDLVLEGKIAIIFQGSPDSKDPHGVLNQYATPRNKTFAARDAGAQALIIITEPDDDQEALMTIRTDRNPVPAGLPAVNITPKIADKIFLSSGYTSKDLYDNLIENRQANSFILHNISADIETELYPIISTDHNVIGFLPGNHPVRKDELIIIGAHYDHLGWGGQGSMVPDEHAIHHGADDNASGTAGLLELAQKFSANRDQLDRSMMFIAFGAEELGLIGSQYYVENPYLPIQTISAMINLDMIGRMQNDELTIFGVGTSPLWEEFIESSPHYGNFNVRTNPDGFGPSDHASFYAKDIPVLFFHTGLHGDYHRPSDTAEKINYEGMERIVSYVYDLAYKLNTYTEPVAFTRADSPQPRGTRGNIRVYVGTMPDIAGVSGGMRVTGVRNDSPAEKAGIMSGDIIIKFGGREIDNVYDYTYALGEYNPGDIVEVVIKRDDKEMTLDLELGARR